jgi:hypothetical protein
MREFSANNINLKNGRIFEVALDQGETTYYAELDVTNHKVSNELLTQEVYWIIGGVEVLHRRLTRTGVEAINKAGEIDTKCRFSGQIHSLATDVKVYVFTDKNVQSSVLVRLT